MPGTKLLAIVDVDPEVVALMRQVHKDLSSEFVNDRWEISVWQADELQLTPIILAAKELGLIVARDSFKAVSEDSFEIRLTERGLRLLGLEAPIPKWAWIKRAALSYATAKLRRVRQQDTQ